MAGIRGRAVLAGARQRAAGVWPLWTPLSAPHTGVACLRPSQDFDDDDMEGDDVEGEEGEEEVAAET